MSAKVPNVVADGSFVGFTGNLSSSSIYSVAADGLYRFNFYQESSGTIHFTLELTFTDDEGSRTLQLNEAWFTANSGGMTIPIRLKNGTSVSVQTINAQVGDTASVYYSIESLS